MSAVALAPIATNRAFLPREKLDVLLDALRDDDRTIIGPIVRDGAVVYDEIRDTTDLPIGWRTDTAPGTYRLEQTGGTRAFDYGTALSTWKRYTHPPRVPLTTTDGDGLVASVDPESLASLSSASALASWRRSASSNASSVPDLQVTPTTRLGERPRSWSRSNAQSRLRRASAHRWARDPRSTTAPTSCWPSSRRGSRFAP
jgi:hypothetical protein